MKIGMALGSLKQSVIVAGLVLLGAYGFAPLLCQTVPEQTLEFEVASIKPHPMNNSGANVVTVVIRRNPPALPKMPGRRFSYHLTTIKILVNLAYDLEPYQVLGLPDWAGSEKGNSEEYYDVEAVAPIDSPTPTQLRAMLQALLVQRCQFKARRETRELRVYALTIAKGGVKFKTITEPESHSSTMFMLIQSLSLRVEYPIVDRTGLAGYYDFPSLHEILLEHPESTPALSGLLAERFGLELKPGREGTDVLVVEHVQRPSENE